jgi:hypothetical protein
MDENTTANSKLDESTPDLNELGLEVDTKTIKPSLRPMGDDRSDLPMY